MSEPKKQPIACAACFFKAHRPPIDEAWVGALMGMMMFELLALCPEHRAMAVKIGEAAVGPKGEVSRARLRVLQGGRSPRREPPGIRRR